MGGETLRQNYVRQCFPILKDFLGYMEVVKGRSINTVEEYFIDLRTFFRTIKILRGLVPPNAEPEDVTID